MKDTDTEFEEWLLEYKKTHITYSPLVNVTELIMRDVWDYQQKKIDELEKLKERIGYFKNTTDKDIVIPIRIE